MRERFCTTRINKNKHQQNCFWINKNQLKMLTTKVDFGWVIFRSIGFISFSIHLTPRSIVFIRFSSLRSSKYQFGCGYFRKVLIKSMKPIRKTIVLNYRPDMFAQTVHAQSTITFYARTLFDKKSWHFWVSLFDTNINNVLCANDFLPREQIIKKISKTVSGSIKTNKN